MVAGPGAVQVPAQDGARRRVRGAGPSLDPVHLKRRRPYLLRWLGPRLQRHRPFLDVAGLGATAPSLIHTPPSRSRPLSRATQRPRPWSTRPSNRTSTRTPPAFPQTSACAASGTPKGWSRHMQFVDVAVHVWRVAGQAACKVAPPPPHPPPVPLSFSRRMRIPRRRVLFRAQVLCLQLRGQGRARHRVRDGQTVRRSPCAHVHRPCATRSPLQGPIGHANVRRRRRRRVHMQERAVRDCFLEAPQSPVRRARRRRVQLQLRRDGRGPGAGVHLLPPLRAPPGRRSLRPRQQERCRRLRRRSGGICNLDMRARVRRPRCLARQTDDRCTRSVLQGAPDGRGAEGAGQPGKVWVIFPILSMCPK